MKVKVRKIKLMSDEPKSFGDHIFIFDPPKTQEEYDRRVKEMQIETERAIREFEAEKALLFKYKDEYFKLFPDDEDVRYYEGCANDGWSETAVFAWAIENKKHWWECPNLSECMSPERAAKAMEEFIAWRDAHPDVDATFG